VTRPLDRTFELLGKFHEDTLELVDLAADLEDEELSTAAERIRKWVAVAGERVARLRAEERVGA
jgi:hypothetical protein